MCVKISIILTTFGELFQKTRDNSGFFLVENKKKGKYRNIYEFINVSKQKLWETKILTIYRKIDRLY